MTVPPSPDAFGPAATAAFRFADGSSHVGERAVPVEVAVELLVNSLPLAVMMASPADLEDFAVGFAITEGVAGTLDDIRAITVERVDAAWRVALTLAPARLSQHLSRQRAMAGRSGCGVCGLRDLDSLPDAGPLRVDPAPVSLDAVARGLAALEAHQPLNAATRAVHAAAFCTTVGDLVAVREDVGRHNALDKLIGALLRGGHAARDGFAIITSRCSFEMVEKAAAFRIPTLVAISAPTSLAIERATRYGIALLAVARADSVLAFTGAERCTSSRSE